MLCRPAAQDQGQQSVMEDCCAWQLLQLFYMLLPRMEGLVTQVCPMITCNMVSRLLAWFLTQPTYSCEQGIFAHEEEDRVSHFAGCFVMKHTACLDRLCKSYSDSGMAKLSMQSIKQANSRADAIRADIVTMLCFARCTSLQTMLQAS